MKTLLKLAHSINGRVEILTFRGNGITSKGYAIVDKDSNEIVTFEPYFGYSGNKWFITNHSASTGKIFYVKRLNSSKVANMPINEGNTGYVFNSK